MDKVYVFDPTASDSQSAVRGIGRYLQILKENFSNEFDFIDFRDFIDFKDSILINPFFNFLKPPLALKRVAKRQIAVIHDLIPLKYPNYFPAGIKGNINIYLNKFALKNYDLIITDSEASKRDIINILHINENRIKVVYPCLPKMFTGPNDKIQMSNQIQISKSKKETDHFPLITNHFCLYVGDATWNKNLVNLATAIKLADINCVFVGKIFQTSAVEEPLQRRDKLRGKTAEVNNGWQSELKQFSELTKNDKRFIFPGFVPDSELINLYQQATLNILPSRDEGFGFSYLEASQFRVPSALSNIPVLREISGSNAMFFNPENPKEISEKIIMLFNNEELRKDVGEKSNERVKYFSQEKFKKDFLENVSLFSSWDS